MYAKVKNFPDSVGGCDIIDEIARGTMGIVYEGYDPVADRPVAIKVSKADKFKDKEKAQRYKEMFEHEANTAKMLHHPNILEVYSSGDEAGKSYIVMELVKHAKTLKDFINADKLLSIEEVVSFALQCASGLEYAHKHGVIHRDIKPANLLVTEDFQIKIADFSIAHVHSREYERTISTGFVGSPRYMSPEQVQEDIVSAQSDLYSLGVVFYELLTGKHPFDANSFSRLIYKVVNEEVVHPSVLRDELPDNLGDYILHALQKDPARRYKSATEIITYFSQIFPENDLSKTISDKQKSHRVSEIKALAIFEGFDEDEINIIVENCIWQKYQSGDQIIKEFDQDDSFYIVDQGEVAVMKHGEPVSNLGKGECFGEMVYLSRQPRTATVTAMSEVTVMKISGGLIGRFSTLSQLRLCRTFLNIVIKRLEN